MKQNPFLRLSLLLLGLSSYNTYPMDYYYEQLPLKITQIAASICISYVTRRFADRWARVNDDPIEKKCTKRVSYLSSKQTSLMISQWLDLQNAIHTDDHAKMKTILSNPQFDFRARIQDKKLFVPYSNKHPALSVYQENGIEYAQLNSFDCMRSFFYRAFPMDTTKELFQLLLDAGLDLQDHDPTLKEYYNLTQTSMEWMKRGLAKQSLPRLRFSTRQEVLFSMAKEHLANKPKIKETVKEALAEIPNFPDAVMDLCAEYA